MSTSEVRSVCLRQRLKSRGATIAALAVVGVFTVNGAVVATASHFAAGWRDGQAGSYLLLAAVIAALGAGVLVLGLMRIFLHDLNRLVLKPLAMIEDTRQRRRRGDLSARPQLTGVREFDDLLTQWDSLLTYRQQAAEHSRILGMILDHVPVGIEVATPDARLEYANPALQAMTGRSLAEIVGRTPKDLFKTPPGHGQVIADAMATVISGRNWRGETTITRQDGKVVDCDLTLCPVLNDDGEIERIVAVRRDITEEKAYQGALIEARQRAEAADLAKSEFLANTSHELRTPLHSIIGFASMLANETLGRLPNDDYREFARLIEHSAQGLLGTINSIIDLSRIQAGQVAVDAAPFAPEYTAACLVSNAMEKATRHNIAMRFHDRARRAKLDGDERMFRCMVEHLIDNAIKFSGPGSHIDVIVRLSAKRQIVVEVRDDGPGIAATKLRHVTRAFYQGESDRKRHHEGVGLGLTLSRQIALAHGGDIKITSPKTGGARVRVVFPAERTITSRQWRQRRRRADNPAIASPLKDAA